MKTGKSGRFVLGQMWLRSGCSVDAPDTVVGMVMCPDVNVCGCLLVFLSQGHPTCTHNALSPYVTHL